MPVVSAELTNSGACRHPQDARGAERQQQPGEPLPYRPAYFRPGQVLVGYGPGQRIEVIAAALDQGDAFRMQLGEGLGALDLQQPVRQPPEIAAPGPGGQGGKPGGDFDLSLRRQPRD